MSTILAIDPGSEKSGLVVWNGARIISALVEENSRVRRTIVDYAATTGPLQVDVLAIEQIGHYGTGMSAGKTVFDTCYQIGRMIECWLRYRDESTLRLVLRPSIKAHLCGSTRAKDANVAQALRDRIGVKGTRLAPGPLHGVTSHAMQALALAVYVSDIERIAA